MGQKAGRGKNISDKIVKYLLNHQGQAVISGAAQAKTFDCTSYAISYCLGSLIKKGVIKALGPMGKGQKNVEFQLIKDVDFDGGRVGQSVKKRRPEDKKENLDLKLSISRELVKVYEDLRKTQDLATQLQAENAKLNGRVAELQEELESEKITQHHEANEIAQLELQLRELRSESTKGARRLLFDQRGVQA